MCNLLCHFQPGCELSIFPPRKRGEIIFNLTPWNVLGVQHWQSGELKRQVLFANSKCERWVRAIRLLRAGKTPSLWMQFAEMKDFACGVSLKYSRFLKRRGQTFSNLWMKVNGSKESESNVEEKLHRKESDSGFKPDALFTLHWRRHGCISLLSFPHTLSDVKLKVNLVNCLPRHFKSSRENGFKRLTIAWNLLCKNHIIFPLKYFCLILQCKYLKNIETKCILSYCCGRFFYLF